MRNRGGGARSSGEIETLQKTYYKLYDNQFSVIAKSAQQIWPEADENVSLVFNEQTQALDSTLIASGSYSEAARSVRGKTAQVAIGSRFNVRCATRKTKLGALL